MRTSCSLAILIVFGALGCAGCSEGSSPAADTPRAPGVTPDPQERQTTMPSNQGASYFCRYVNPFSRQAECKAYVGTEWTEATASADCAVVFTGAMGMVDGAPCETAGAIGTCTTDGSGPRAAVTWYYGGDPTITESACANFAHGEWSASGAGGEQSSFGAATPEALEALASGGGVTVTPGSCTDDGCIAGLIEARRGIEVAPEGASPKTGLIVYPGAGVDVRAYAPIARALASTGRLVVLVPMPDRFAVGGADRALGIIEAHPEISRWVLGGHSMGGAAAASFAHANPSRIHGLVLWGSYPGEGDSVSGLPVYVLHGTEDAIVTPEEIAAHRALLPEDAVIIPLIGANHAQFGAYGLQEGDGEAKIPRATQHALVAGATAHLLRRVEIGSRPIHPAFGEADAISAGFCAEAQRIVAGASEDELPDEKIADEAWTDAVAFGRAKPEISGDGSGTIQIHSYASQGANPTWMEEPPALAGEVWCKLKSADALAEELGGQRRSGGACRDVNQAILDRVLASLSADELARYRASGKTVAFDEDVSTTSGPEWYGGAVELRQEGTVQHVRSPALVVPLDANIDASGRGVHYCKLWSLGRALEWVLFTSTSAP